MPDDYELHPYQHAGAHFLAGRRHALLADEMGLGKSAQAIRACDLRNAGRILVLCPAIARVNWQREFARFSVYGLPARALFSRRDRPLERGITVCSYDLAISLKAELGAIQWDVMICDEAHYLKSMEARRTKLVLGKAGLVRSAQSTWFLTGTPMTNHPGDLWPMLFVWGICPLNYKAFIERYCTVRETPFGRQITGAKPDMVPELKAMLAKIMLRRRKTDVLKDLPPIKYSTITVEPGPIDLEIRLYDLWRRSGGDEKLKAIVDQQETAMAQAFDALSNSRTPLRDMLPVLTGMDRSLSELRQYTGLAKCPAVIEIVAAELEANAYDKIVLFAVHKCVIESLQEGLRKFKPATIYGGTPPAKRQAHLDRFAKDPRYRVMVCNIAACGTAVSMTAAAEAMFVELDWTPANNAQAAMRVHRMGQTRPVRVRFAALADSTDERVTEALRRKTRDEVAIFG